MTRRVTRAITLEAEDAEWYETMYPSGSYSWLFSAFLKEFRNLHKDNNPVTYMKLGAEEIKRMMEDS